MSESELNSLTTGSNTWAGAGRGGGGMGGGMGGGGMSGAGGKDVNAHSSLLANDAKVRYTKKGFRESLFTL